MNNTHKIDVWDRSANNHWRARCTCGWSLVVTTRTSAQLLADEHVRTHNGYNERLNNALEAFEAVEKH